MVEDGKKGERLEFTGCVLGASLSPDGPNAVEQNKGQREFRCRFVKAGRVKSGGDQLSDIEITPGALLAAVTAGKFESRAVFVDHAGLFDHPSLKNLAGVTHSTSWNPDNESVEGCIRLYAEASPVAGLLDEILAGGEAAPDVGLSMVFWPQWEQKDDGRRTTADGMRRIVGVRYVESIDLVFQPAADGRILEALSAWNVEACHRSSVKCRAMHGTEDGDKNNRVEVSSPIVEVSGPYMAPLPNGSQSINSISDVSGGITMDGDKNNREKVLDSAAPAEQAMFGGAEQPHSTEPKVEPPAQSSAAADAWLQAMSRTAAVAMLASANLPQASKERLATRKYETPGEVESAIEAERAYLAKLSEGSVIQIGSQAPRGGQIQTGLDALDKLSLAVDGLLSGLRPAEGVAPLTGVRELYILLSGDYEMTGMFQPERVQFANANSSTMASLVANALNKRVVNLFHEYPRWWERIVTQEDFNSLQAIRWTTLGGVGELPTVAEGAAYTELTWDDSYETASFAKKGGYLGITLETIDKDDTRKVQAAPRALAQAAWLTLSKAVSGIFTSNSGVGPTLVDTGALFNSTAVTSAGGHANLGTTALSITTWAAARLAMRKQVELNSGERLGALTAPKYLLVPPDLEITALEILGSEKDFEYTLSSGIEAPDNVFTEGANFEARMRFAKDRVIVVDLWTDTNDWAAVADPKLYPTIGLAFRYGRTPEIFSVASPTAGLMFTNDTFPVKVRFFFATGPMDWRGLYKANVTGG